MEHRTAPHSLPGDTSTGRTRRFADASLARYLGATLSDIELEPRTIQTGRTQILSTFAPVPDHVLEEIPDTIFLPLVR
jgi:hypothetical protein